MRNTFAIKFYCREAKAKKDGKAPVEVSLIVRGDRQMWQLPKFCEPSKFKSLGSKSDVKIYCHNVENKLNEIYTSLSLAGEPISAFIIKDIFVNGTTRYSYTLNKMFEDGLQLKVKENCEPRLYDKYVLTKDRFLEYTGIDGNREAGVVKYNDIMVYKAKLDNTFKPNTVVKELQRTKFFFLLAFNSGKIKANPFASITIKKPQTENIFLTQEEIGKIRDLRITNDRLDKIRSTFLFMCYSGLEYADMAELIPEDVQTSPKGQLYIKKKRVKTGIEYISILYRDAVEVWNLYDGKLPLVSNAKFNLYLKEIQKAAGIDKNLTTLICRHSYATFLLNECSLPIDIVSKMLGHTNTVQTKTYAKMLDTSVFEANTNAQQHTVAKPVTKAQTPELPDDDLEAFQILLGIKSSEP